MSGHLQTGSDPLPLQQPELPFWLLCRDVCLDVLDAFLETQVAFDFVFAAGAFHLRDGGEDDFLDVFGV